MENNKLLLYRILRDVISEKRSFVFCVRGKSMRPILKEGRDKVEIIPINRPLKRGDLVVAEVDKNLFFIHRIIYVDEDKVILRGDGNLKTECCPIMNVIGIASKIYRKNRVVYCDGFWWNFYSRIWINLPRWLRILGLGFYARTCN